MKPSGWSFETSLPSLLIQQQHPGFRISVGVQSRISAARNEVQFREGEAPAEPCVFALQWLGSSLALIVTRIFSGHVL